MNKFLRGDTQEHSLEEEKKLGIQVSKMTIESNSMCTSSELVSSDLDEIASMSEEYFSASSGSNRSKKVSQNKVYPED